MYYVYVLRDVNSKIYIGYSADLKKRINHHKSGRVKSTKTMLGIQLFYYEAYINRRMATERERKLKTFGSSYQGLMKRIGLK